MKNMILRMFDAFLCGSLVGQFILFESLPDLFRCVLLGLAFTMGLLAVFTNE
jgi:hypothetical protein